MNERLREELRRALAVLDRTHVAWLDGASDDLRTYDVGYDVRTFYRDGANVAPRDGTVRVRICLHAEHPHVAPFALARTRGLFNPHVLDPERAQGGQPALPLLCLGPFQSGSWVGDDWLPAIHGLLRWSRVAPAHPLDEEAAAFARTGQGQPGLFPSDPRPFFFDEPADAAGAEPGPGTLRIVSAWRTS